MKCTQEGGSHFYESSAPINGLGKEARDFSAILSKMTLQKGLKDLTLVHLNELLPFRGLLKQYRSWCPACFQEWERNDKEIYEPLIWNMQILTSCPKHKCVLKSAAPFVDKGIILNRKYIPGYCSRCLTWLGTANISSTVENEWIEWILRNIQELLDSNNFQYLTSKNYVKGLKLLVMDVTNGNTTAFSRIIHKSKSSVRAWILGDNIPTLENMIRMGSIFGLTILNICTQQIDRKNNDVNLEFLSDQIPALKISAFR